jgi:hypothetical protein
MPIINSEKGENLPGRLKSGGVVSGENDKCKVKKGEIK